jgi:hypothetical protein
LTAAIEQNAVNHRAFITRNSLESEEEIRYVAPGMLCIPASNPRYPEQGGERKTLGRDETERGHQMVNAIKSMDRE